MNILYMNVRGVIGETGRAMRAQGHKLVLRSECVEALESIRNETFGAVVIEDESPGAHSFGHVLLRCGATFVFEVDAGLDGDIGKGHRGILLQRGAEIRHGNDRDRTGGPSSEVPHSHRSH